MKANKLTLVEPRTRWLNAEYTHPLGVTFTEDQVRLAEQSNGILGTFCGIICIVASPCPVLRNGALKTTVNAKNST